MFEELTPKRIEIFLELLNSKKGLKINEIAKKFNTQHPAVLEHIKILEKSGFVRTNYEKGKHGVAKLCFPSFTGFFLPLAKHKGMRLTDEDLKAIDDFFLHKKIKQIILDSIFKKEKTKGYELTSIFTSFSPLSVRLFTALMFSLSKAEAIVKRDVELQKLAKSFENVLKKLI